MPEVVEGQAAVDDGARPQPTGSGRSCLVAIGVIIGVLVLGFGACSYVVSRALDFNLGPQHRLKPIPVPTASCPYLRLVSATAQAAGEASGSAGRDPNPSAWPGRMMDIRQKLTTFHASLHAAQRQVPAPIARKLAAVDAQVRTGIRNLESAPSGDGWTGSTLGPIMSGYSSLLDASDLTGDACGFTLAPSIDVFLSPSTTIA